MILTHKEDRIETTIRVPEDATLTEAFAYFIRLTEIAGYVADSWNNVIAEVAPITEDDTSAYSMYDWARDTIFESQS